MLERIRLWLIALLLKKEMGELIEWQEQAEQKVNARVARTLAQMDPFEPLLKQYNGVFSEEFERPEEKLDPRSHLSFTMWAYQQNKDPNLTYLLDWIANTAGNETIKRAPITPERTQYGRAQIANIVLFKRELSRLSNLYEEALEKGKPKEFDSELTVE